MTIPKHEKLKLPFFYSFIGIIGIFGIVITGIHQFLTKESDQWIGLSLFILIFGFLSSYILLAGQVYHIINTDNELIQRTWYGSSRRIKWTDISKISFGKISLELTISDGNSKIKAHAHLNGFENLITKLEYQTGSDRKDFEL